METTLQAKLAHYAESHRDRRNVIIHCICVPAIVFAVIGLLMALNILVAIAAMIVATVYYARIDPDRAVGIRAAATMAVMMVAMLVVWLVLVPPGERLAAAVAIFVLAWIGQFVGHHLEGQKPSFFDDLRYLLVGPLFVAHELTPSRKAAWR
ncbi:DUF962 domain-containing protein [Acidiphilium sp. AL]|uniref:Mpo1 family 2-hydroxy fatty acid dioxygenase n=1 Tax=Acidiphilium sp. AL TaxID=2871704 RepID=UPI0021CB8882|nr:Mpo1-like protein [Acidiphilium sp. AL]MCU4158698.1 DUF962 domain-containing protein [Acidiphilium sp. AL]